MTASTFSHRIPTLIATTLLAFCCGSGCAPQSNSAAKAPAAKGASASADTKVASPATTLDVYFVRHGETEANATGKYNSRTINALSAKGETEILQSAKLLNLVHLDQAIVSPSLRCELTAAPILRDHNLTATIWPELNECCTEHGAARNIPPTGPVRYSGPVTLPKGMENLFKIRPDGTRMVAFGNYQDGINQVKLLLQVFHAKFDSYRGSVLVVGHSANGARFMEGLLGRPLRGAIQVGNACVVHFRRTPAGKFVVVSSFGTSLKPDPKA